MRIYANGYAHDHGPNRIVDTSLSAPSEGDSGNLYIDHLGHATTSVQKVPLSLGGNYVVHVGLTKADIMELAKIMLSDEDCLELIRAIPMARKALEAAETAEAEALVDW